MYYDGTNTLMTRGQGLPNTLATAVCGQAGFGLVAGGSPSFAFWWATSAFELQVAVQPSTVGAGSVNNPFSITRIGAGNYQVMWTAKTFPLFAAPRSYLTASGAGHIAMGITAQYIGTPTDGVEVWTFADGALADLNFMVDLF